MRNVFPQDVVVLDFRQIADQSEWCLLCVLLVVFYLICPSSPFWASQTTSSTSRLSTALFPINFLSVSSWQPVRPHLFFRFGGWMPLPSFLCRCRAPSPSLSLLPSLKAETRNSLNIQKLWDNDINTAQWEMTTGHKLNAGRSRRRVNSAWMIKCGTYILGQTKVKICLETQPALKPCCILTVPFCSLR